VVAGADADDAAGERACLGELVCLGASLWVPDWPSTAVTCDIRTQWRSGVIVGRGGTTTVSDLPAGHGLVSPGNSRGSVGDRRAGIGECS
jgi:hypothetical protein